MKIPATKTPISLSLFDIEILLERNGQKLQDYDEESLKEALYSIGFDKKYLEEEVVLHRPIFSPNNQPWHGKRFISFERQDKEWKNYRLCSLENIIGANEDMDHRLDLIRMSQRLNTLDILEKDAASMSSL